MRRETGRPDAVGARHESNLRAAPATRRVDCPVSLRLDNGPGGVGVTADRGLIASDHRAGTDRLSRPRVRDVFEQTEDGARSSVDAVRSRNAEQRLSF